MIVFDSSMMIFLFWLGSKEIDIPKKIAKNKTCNMLPSTKDRNGFLGIILKIVFQNPDKFLYSCKFGSCLNRCLISLIFSPKWKTLPKNKPNTIAKTVDIKKKDKTNKKCIYEGKICECLCI